MVCRWVMLSFISNLSRSSAGLILINRLAPKTAIRDHLEFKCRFGRGPFGGYPVFFSCLGLVGSRLAAANQDPGISQLRYDPSADELTCQNDLMSDPSADRWANIFYHVRSRMRTSCTRLDQGSISHADGFFLAGTWS